MMLTKKNRKRSHMKRRQAYIEEIPKFTKKHTLEHTKTFLKRLGNPAAGQKNCPRRRYKWKRAYVHTYRPYLWQRGREQGSLHPLILYL